MVSLSGDARRWGAESVGPGATVRTVSLLPGATSSTLYALDVERGGRVIPLVLRLFTNAEWRAEEPDLARHEAAALTALAQAAVPTPELVAFDETGERCGVPAILMTRLPGSVVLRPDDFDAWLSQMADALVPVHVLAADDFPWLYFPYMDLPALSPPSWSRHPHLWKRAIEIVNGPRPESRPCFIHRDYHPNNVLWENGRLTGVVDWPNASRGAAGIDVAWNRQNLAQLYGVTAADRFLTLCERADGKFEYHPHWDLICAAEFLPGPPGVYPGWPAMGVTHLTDALMRERVDDYLASVMARV